MEEKKMDQTFLDKENDDCKEIAEVLRRIPKSRKREARMMLEGFALCAESEKKVV